MTIRYSSYRYDLRSQVHNNHEHFNPLNPELFMSIDLILTLNYLHTLSQISICFVFNILCTVKCTLCVYTQGTNQCEQFLKKTVWLV